MTTEDNQFGYDELRWLAKDTHKSRQRAIWWTAGLTAGAMALAVGYVTRDQDSNGEDPPSVHVTLDMESIPATLEEIRDYLKTLADKDPPMMMTNFGVLGQDEGVTSAFALSNVVWLADGSRRFPMALNDVLWIPEVDRWFTLVTPGSEGYTPSDPPPPDQATTSVRRSTAPPQPPPAAPQGEIIELPHWQPSERGQLGNIDCVVINARGPSQRPGFRPRNGVVQYWDIEVEFFNADPNQRPCAPP